jgi:hypothetical protein
MHIKNGIESPGELFATEELNSCLRDVEARHGVHRGMKSDLIAKGLTIHQIASELREASKDVFDWSRFGSEEMQLSTCEAFLQTIYWSKDSSEVVPLAREVLQLNKEDGSIPITSKHEVPGLSPLDMPAGGLSNGAARILIEDPSGDVSMEDAPLAYPAQQINGTGAISTAVNSFADSVTTPLGNQDSFRPVGRKSLPPTVSAKQYLQGDDMEGLRDQWREAASAKDPFKALNEDAKNDSLLQKILALDEEEQDIESQLATLESEESLRRAEFKSRELCFTTTARFRNPLSCNTDWEESRKLSTEQEEFAFDIYCRKRKLVKRRESRIREENRGTEMRGTVGSETTDTCTNGGQDVAAEDMEKNRSEFGLASLPLARGNRVGSQLLRYLAKIPGWQNEVVESVEPGFEPGPEPGPGPGKRKKPRKKMNW